MKKTTNSKKASSSKINKQLDQSQRVKRKMLKGPSRKVNIGVVNLGEDTSPKYGKKYSIVSAYDEYLQNLPVPSTKLKYLGINVYNLYIDNLRDFTKKNEALLRVSINTKDPQLPQNPEQEVLYSIGFDVEDGNYSPSFTYRALFRHVVFDKFVNLGFNLYEIDTDADEYLNKIETVIEGVPELENLDILNGIPYLNVATKLFSGIIRVFGKNPDDHVWGEVPIFEIKPHINGAFLRSAIYIIFEEKNKTESFTVADFQFLNEKLVLAENSSKKGMPNHLIFSIELDEFVEDSSRVILYI